MLVYYKLFDLLRKKGLFQKELIDNNVINGGTLQRLRKNMNVTSDVLAKICCYLNCNIEDICEYVPSTEEKKEESV